MGFARPDDADFATWPPVYHTFAERWPDAFEYYRHNAFRYVSGVLDFVPWGDLLISSLRRIAAIDVEGYRSLLNALLEGGERLANQRRNAARLAEARGQADTPEQDLLHLLQAYALTYEMEFPLWFIGVVGRGLRTGRLDATYLGGPVTSTAQGSLIDQLQEDVTRTPLAGALSSSYDRELRNTVGHNDFEIRGGGETLKVVDSRSGTTWSRSEVLDRLVAAEHLIQSAILASQLVMAEMLDPPEGLRDCGVVGITYPEPRTDRQPPMIIITQLWCFRDLDPSGAWLDTATFRYERAPEGSATFLTDNVSASGPGYNERLARRFEEAGMVRVLRVPIAPDLGSGFSVRTVGGDRFEVVGIADEHFVPVK